ncbi:DUF294 nucleotidyltransferase-like domain-containing protein [Halalkalibacter urbisdiaboli]|uniref:DUF294 nucleotidyltransferase-like domain-containing protein n=1 Tax=Halalkalibacter urbisdiaboli TaxID=1960589 RepID=UPI000B445968|nr:DUF294 nucleotidyltransferase-like domain-containing protein [Halalkalibacter urbisdiaboli]
MVPQNNQYLQKIHEHPLFAGLDEQECLNLLDACVLKQYEKNETVLYSKTPREGLLLLLKGMAEVFVNGSGHRQREVLEVLQTGDVIGFSSLADFLGEKTEHPEHYTVEVAAVEESVCLHIPYSVIEARWHDEQVRDYVLTQATVRLRDIYASLAEQVRLANQWGESEPFIRRIQDVMNEPVIIVDEDEDVQDVALTMVKQSTSSVVVLNDADQLIGIITEKDLVARVVAKGRGTGIVAKEIMTPHPFIISRQAYYYEAMASFLMNGIKHLPVMDGSKVVGMVTLADLLRKKDRGTMQLLQTIEESTEENSKDVKLAIYDVLGHLIQDRIPTTHLLDIITKLYDRLVRHTVELTLGKLKENGFGDPPVSYSFYMMGSGGRREQFMLTDQDHFLVFADPSEAEREQVEHYFQAFGEELVNQLELAGYKRCDGLMMSSEAIWRGSLSQWQERLRSWALRATNDNVLLSQNFLSYRFLYGEDALHDQFVKMVRDQLQKSKIFLYRMAELEKETPVPVLDHPIRALFRMQRRSIDLKKHAIFPLHHCLQLLSAKHDIVYGTPLERLDALENKHVISAETADELRFAYEVILSIRVEQAWAHYKRGSEKTSEVEFTHLKSKDKEELMIALKAIRHLQNQVIAGV